MAFRLVTTHGRTGLRSLNYMSSSATKLSTGNYYQATAPVTTLSSSTNPPPATLSLSEKVVLPPMVYISGEEMTHYACNLMIKQWIDPLFDTSRWEKYDLSCKSRDDTDDQVLKDAVAAGKRVKAIYKEPTITPSAIQVKEMGLKKAFGSPNGAMRRGWKGITISRDTIHIDGVELGYRRPVLFERHAVGGEYGAGWDEVGRGTLVTTYIPKDAPKKSFVVDSRELTDDHNVCVVYHNPYDNIADLAHIFYKRCLDVGVTPYVVTKKTVFKWQEGYWATMKSVFDEHYKKDFVERGLMDRCGGELQHLISDAATMQLIRWTDGGFGMAAHNYDGDMLTDQIAQVHRSPGFITSNLVGKADDGTLIKEFEASHGTVSDLWNDHLAGKETSLNPLGLTEALIGAMQHSAKLELDANPDCEKAKETHAKVTNFTYILRHAIHNTFRYGQGTRDMSGPEGFTTEDFISKVAWRVQRYLARQEEEEEPPILGEVPMTYRRNYDVDQDVVKEMFQKYDKNGDGTIDMNEFTRMLVKMGIAPTKKDRERSPDV